jgi:uncharacterized protein YdeI (YjbR/CyaY-like superfamily)
VPSAHEHAIDAIPFSCAEEWREWLHASHATASECWIAFPKQASGIPGVRYAEAVREALCFGWIDGQSRSVDDVWFVQRFTPRRADSVWSQRMRALALELIADGSMQPRGLAAVNRAKTNGRWAAAYAGPSSIEVPEVLRDALAASPRAADAFATLDGTNRYAILHRLAIVKTEATRARKAAEYVAMLERGERIHSTDKR